MKKFEYKTVEVKGKGLAGMKYDFPELEALLTGFGLQGWEMVTCQQLSNPSNGRQLMVFFMKREIEV